VAAFTSKGGAINPVDSAGSARAGASKLGIGKDG
jgi:hypothetical protein